MWFCSKLASSTWFLAQERRESVSGDVGTTARASA